MIINKISIPDLKTISITEIWTWIWTVLLIIKTEITKETIVSISRMGKMIIGNKTTTTQTLEIISSLSRETTIREWLITMGGKWIKDSTKTIWTTETDLIKMETVETTGIL